ncbi:SDR family oxidoreductase [Methylomonas paludis]|uniref:SDR family oxidoreductase n=1 Tax=Methylomonas paludis TaxID=1173101 RepID=A0A975R930_9GAMM|nr:SDR family oxidoreductase [Methylomonas paludis]QWF71015.1 SDR family oxidoreductase [Methylomonas paludis]
MRKVLIVGAASAIATATARLWAVSGDYLFLVGRNAQKLEVLAEDLRVRGCPKVEIYALDVNDFAAHGAMLDAAEQSLGGLDTVLIAHGSLPDQQQCQVSLELTLQEINTNALSVIALLTLIGNRFAEKHTGTIAVISSVAGDRGRMSNYVYGSAKAMVSTFSAGLRQRLQKSGVTVLTIKPGFVDTPMTAAFKKGLLWASADQVAADIVTAVNKKTAVLYTPFFWRYIMLIIKIIPEALFKKLSL